MDYGDTGTGTKVSDAPAVGSGAHENAGVQHGCRRCALVVVWLTPSSREHTLVYLYVVDFNSHVRVNGNASKALAKQCNKDS